jgi:nuclear receptor interaction protein
VPQPTAEEEDDDENYVAHNGLASRRRMQDSYRIMNQNDVERQGGNQDAFLTVRDLHPLLLIMGRAFW